MPKWLTAILGSGGKAITDGVANIMDKHTGKKERDIALAQLVAMESQALGQQITATIGAKERVLVAELHQGDKFTKRARPAVVYAGLGALFLNHILLPWAAYFGDRELPVIDLPTEFWIAWGGITGTWAVGRTIEKVKSNGVTSKVGQFITGGSKRSSILGD